MCKSNVSYEKVKEYVNSTGNKLLTLKKDFKLTNNLEILCGHCEKVFKTRYGDYKNRKYNMCKQCGLEVKRKENFNEFENFVKRESNCILVTTYKNFKNNQSKLTFTCECGNEFVTTSLMFIHSNKRQCNECGSKNKGQSKKITYKEVKDFINNHNCSLITSEKEYINATQNISIKCSCGNIFKNTFSQFKYGKTRRCNECYRKELSQRHLITYEKVKYFVEVSSQSGCKIVTTEDDYVNSRLNILFKCKCGEQFETSFHEFKSGNKRQCNICGLNYMKVETFIKMFEDEELVNKCKLIDFKETEGFIHYRNLVTLECSCGEIFTTQRGHFTDRNKNRCDLCSSTISKGEYKIRQYLIKANIVFKREVTFKECKGSRRVLPFDFAIFNNDILYCLIEYDGKQHFEPVNFGGCSDEVALLEHNNLTHNDSIKNKYCEHNNIKLIRIPYWDFDNIEDILNKELHSLL